MALATLLGEFRELPDDVLGGVARYAANLPGLRGELRFPLLDSFVVPGRIGIADRITLQREKLRDRVIAHVVLIPARHVDIRRIGSRGERKRGERRGNFKTHY